MAKIESTEILVSAVKNNGPDGFYPVMAYLRDACSPSVRPLYNEFMTHNTHTLLAAGLVMHRMDDGRYTYELVLQDGLMIKTFQVGTLGNGSEIDFRSVLKQRAEGVR